MVSYLHKVIVGYQAETAASKLAMALVKEV
jgi:hypothetical protein